MYNYINKVCANNDFAGIAQDMRSVINYFTPTAEVYAPIVTKYLSGVQTSDVKEHSVFNAQTPERTVNVTHSQPLSAPDINTEGRENHSEELSEFYHPVVFEGLPVVGKLNSVPEKMEDKNFLSAGILGSLAALNGPEELRDVFEAYKQIKSMMTGTTYKAPYNYKEYQHPFSFFRGTLLHNVLNPNNPKNISKKLSTFVVNKDKSLIDTRLGDFVIGKLNLKKRSVPTSIKDITYTKDNNFFVNAYKFSGEKNCIGKFIARAMTRTPVIGLSVYGGLEGINACHEIKKGKDTATEIGKAAARWSTSAIITGICGAAGSFVGPVGSLIGTSLGAILSAAVAKAIG